MKDIKFLVVLFSCLSVIMLVGCSENGVMLEEDYYVRIEGKAEQTANNENQYVYNLNGFDKDGNEKVVSFFVDKPYEEGTLIRIPRSLEGYTGEAKVIGIDELPEKVKEKFNLD